MSGLTTAERETLLDVLRSVEHVGMTTGTWEQGKVLDAMEGILGARSSDWRATEAVLRGEIRRAESAMATYDDLAARLAQVETLRDTWRGWADGRSTPRIDAFRDAAEALDTALSPAQTDTTTEETE